MSAVDISIQFFDLSKPIGTHSGGNNQGMKRDGKRRLQGDNNNACFRRSIKREKGKGKGCWWKGLKYPEAFFL